MRINRSGSVHRMPSPWNELENATQELSRLFCVPGSGRGLAGWNPPVNVEETDEEIFLAAELPGMAIEDIEIEVKDNVLTIQGEKAEEEEEENRQYHVRERCFGSFKRTFSVPRSVNTDEISAQFQDGILSIRLPKIAEAKARKVSIKS